jgi:hypothetical protein
VRNRWLKQQAAQSAKGQSAKGKRPKTPR